MIEYIHLINFGIHKDLFLEFSPGKNFIIGENDSGKSTIIRAFDCIINNNIPQNVNYLNKGCKGNEAFEIHMGVDSHKVSRIKSKTRNEYRINDGNPLTGFSKNVPKDVADIIKFSDVNIQFQKSPPFLLEESGGEVSRYLNKTIDLDIIDTTFKNIDKMKRDCKKRTDEIEKELIETENKLREFEYIEKLELKLIDIEELEETIIENEDSIKESEKDIENWLEFQEGLYSCSLILENEKKLNTVIKLNECIKEKDKMLFEAERNLDHFYKINMKLYIFQDIEEKEKKLEKIKKLNDQITKSADEFNDKSKRLSDASDIYLGYLYTNRRLQAINKLLEKEDNIKYLISLEIKIDRINNYIENEHEYLINLQSFNANLKEKKEELEKLEKKHKEKLGNRCPLCKQKIV